MDPDSLVGPDVCHRRVVHLRRGGLVDHLDAARGRVVALRVGQPDGVAALVRPLGTLVVEDGRGVTVKEIFR